MAETVSVVAGDLRPVQANLPCPRCGDYAVLVPLLGDPTVEGPELCRACMRRLPSTITEPIGVWSVIRAAVICAWKVAPIYLPLRFALIPFEAVLRVEAGSFARMLLDIVIALVGVPILTALADRAVLGTPSSVRGALMQGLLRASNYARTAFVASVIVLPRLLLIVPGVIRSLELALVGPLAVLEGVGAAQAIQTSTEWMQGKRATLLGAVAITFLGGFLVVIAISVVLAINGFTPAGLGFQLVTIPLAAVALLPQYLVPYVVYAKARHAHLLDADLR